ncbi:hypothetical protein TFLX_05774 [Thermoflexales bacterium]|nr:hypothetical protein TFLX_05774 [Thermoflexales bacterium]
MKTLIAAVLLMVLLSSCTPIPPKSAQTALGVIFGERPIVYAQQVDVKGFDEFWCVVLESESFVELGSVQILKDHDGGWNASLYKNRANWEFKCGTVPTQFENRLHVE